MTESAEAAVTAGYLARADADAMIAQAEAAPVPPAWSPVPTSEVAEPFALLLGDEPITQCACALAVTP